MRTMGSMSTFDLSSLSLPIVQAPMAGGPSTPALAAAVSDAGGLGSLATGYLSAEAAESQLEEFRSLSDGPVAVNVFVPEAHASAQPDVHAYRDALAAWASSAALHGAIPPVPVPGDTDRQTFSAILTMLVRTAPDVVTFTFGLPDGESIARLQAAGITVGVTVTSLAEARAAVGHGADVLIAQGVEAGGHRSQFDQGEQPNEIPAVSLTRTLAEELSVPVIGAGGVDGAVTAGALLDAGAAAVQVGTLFLTTDEAGTKPTHRAALLRRDGRRTVVTRVFTGRPARALENRFTAEMAQHAVTGYPEVHVLTGGIRSEAAAQDDPEHLHLWAGTGYAACAEESAASVLARFSPLRRDGDVASRGDRPTS